MPLFHAMSVGLFRAPHYNSSPITFMFTGFQAGLLAPPHERHRLEPIRLLSLVQMRWTRRNPPGPFAFPPAFSCPYDRVCMIEISGMNKATTMVPTTTARKMIRIGSMMDVMAATALSMSSS